MHRAQYATRGPVPQDVIECVEFSLPPLAAGEALVQVLAAPINPSDVLTLTGQYGMLPPLPAVGGNEGVGRVLEVGEGVRLPVGQRVVLPVGAGTWTSHLVAREEKLTPLPEVGDPVQLSMLSVNPPTAALLLSEFVTLEPGEWVIQNTANSAVGRYLIQLAQRRGLRTVNVVRREEAAASLRAMGADVVLTDGPDLDKRVADATDKAKIRLGIDAAGGAATDRIARSLAVGGTVVNYGAMSGEACKIAPASFVFRDITLRGFWLAYWFRRASVDTQRALFSELAQLVAGGKLTAPVQATYPLEQIKEAIVAAASPGRDGKVVIVPR
ncbi:MAG: zinc-dependent alcohol dehydrogenase family protein [Gemmatimonadaceae bacterium]|jgi:trans-2-enoyl-CoA reductase|nr:zinc-dependent alcohol dehydrogenase family protein [Gemmatimonadaceae bacterium]MCC6432572.1 zinc-dependent alcohol dehydrogenase family protein [Gemmatimonadaceae bacterium]